MEQTTDPKKTARQRMEELAPEYVSELMTEFMTKVDLVERQKIRRRIRAMLDLFSADTKWPQGRPDVQQPRRPGPALFNPPGMGAYIPEQRQQDARGADDLVEPPPAEHDAIPVPGAGLAELGDLPPPPRMV